MGEKKPTFRRDEIMFNGSVVGDNDHETFHLHKDPVSEFCKTARKPYDIVVVACLAALKDIFDTEISVSSDGGRDEWEDGVALACRVLGRPIANPIED